MKDYTEDASILELAQRVLGAAFHLAADTTIPSCDRRAIQDEAGALLRCSRELRSLTSSMAGGAVIEEASHRVSLVRDRVNNHATPGKPARDAVHELLALADRIDARLACLFTEMTPPIQ